MIEFFIPFEVQPKQGDRSGIVMTNGGKPFIHHYQPVKVRRNADVLTLLIAQHAPAIPLKGPLRLDVVFQSPWRKTESQKRRITARLKDTRPDWDNLCKQLCDVMQHAGFYTNDAQLADVRIRKVWADSPGVQVRIEGCE